MDNDPNNATPEEASNTFVWITIWGVALVLFLCLPCVFNASKRQTCLRRIHERRWDVEIEPSRDDSVWYRMAQQRYEASLAQNADAAATRTADGPSRLSKEEKEEIRQVFLVEQMSKYTTTLGESDFKRKSDQDPVISEANAQMVGTLKDTDVEMGNAIHNETGEEGDTNEDFDGDEIIQDQNVFGHSGTFVCVPPAGVCIAAAASDKPFDDTLRDVPNGCAICLSEFNVGEPVTWAAYQQCPHVFHEECILNWQLAVGRRKRRGEEEESPGSDDDLVKKALDFPMLCPCCRQQYVYVPEDTKLTTSQSDAASTQESASAQGAEDNV